MSDFRFAGEEPTAPPPKPSFPDVDGIEEPEKNSPTAAAPTPIPPRPVPPQSASQPTPPQPASPAVAAAVPPRPVAPASTPAAPKSQAPVAPTPAAQAPTTQAPAVPTPAAPSPQIPPLPKPPAQSTAVDNALEDPVTPDEVFAGLSPRIRNRPHIPPPESAEKTVLKPAAATTPQNVPQAPRNPAAPKTPAAPRTPAAPHTAHSPSAEPHTPAAPPPARNATPRAPGHPPPVVHSAAAHSPAAPSPPVPAANPAARNPKAPTPAIPTTAIPPGMMPQAVQNQSASTPHGTPQFSGSHRDTNDWSDEITKFAPIAATILNFAAGIGALALAFLVYEVASGRAYRVSETGNMNTAAAVFNICAVAAAVGLIVSNWNSRSVGPSLLVSGIVFMAAIPAFLPPKIHSIASLFQGGGFFLLLLGLIKVGLDFAIGTSDAPKTTTVRTAPPSQQQGAPRAPHQTAHAAAAYSTPAGHVAHPTVRSPGDASPSMPAIFGATSQDAEIIEDENQFSAMLRFKEGLDPIATWVFRIAAFFAAASLVYLLYGIFAGRIGQGAAPGSLASNLKTAATIFHFSSILLAISGLWLALDMAYLGLALIAIGLAIHLGAPWLLLNHVGKTNLVTAIATSLRSTGFALAIIGVLKQAYEVVVWAMDLPNRMKQKADVGFAQQAEPAQRRVAREANMMSPCWKLPFCREVIRKQCPAFLANKTCWKFGRGCYCDEEMIGRIIRGEALEVIKAPTRLSQSGKAPCGRCHIYLEHQGFKFKMLSPLAFPLTAAIMFFIWPMYSSLFRAFSNAPIWNFLSVDKSKLTPEAIATSEANKAVSSISDDQVIYFATILIGILLGFFVFVYVSKFIEWAIYRAKL